MKSNATIVYSFCLVIGDFLALVAAFLAGFLIRGRLSSIPVAHPIHLVTFITIFATLLPFWIIVFALLGLYNSNIYEQRFRELARLFIGAFIGLMFVTFWAFIEVTPIFPSKLVPIYGFIIGFLLVLTFRNLARSIRTILFDYNIGLTKVLIVGNTGISQELIESLTPEKSGYQIVGVVGAKSLVAGSEIPGFNTFKAFIDGRCEKPDGIIQTELYAYEGKNREILEYCQEHHVNFRFVPGNTELFVGNIEVELFKSSLPVIAVHRTPLFGWGRVVKRIFDLFVGSLILIITSPLLLLIAILIKLSGGGTVFFRQTRLTRFNHEFRVFKFHTHYQKFDGTTPEEAFVMIGKPELAKRYRKNGDFLANDPRVTPLGRVLRATSLDELPQLFNVLAGDLSLVGPRPLIPQELSVYEKHHAILNVKSGLTGLAQVSGRRDIPFDERRKLDLYYVQNWSFWLDLTILIKTFRTVLGRAGAK